MNYCYASSTPVQFRSQRDINQPPSFIDFNADKSYEQDMNAGLGTETLIYEGSLIIITTIDIPTFEVSI